MSDDEDPNKTQMDFDAIIDDAQDRGVIDKKGGYRLKNRFRINSKWGKFFEHIEKHWKKWLLGILAGGATFRDSIESVIISIAQLINVVD